MGPTGEDGKTIETGEEGGDGRMCGGKAVPVALMKSASDRWRDDEDRRGASWSTQETSWRWRARAEALAGQRRIAWLVFITGRGGASFSLGGPALDGPGGRILFLLPAPPPSGAQPHSFPGRAPVCHHQKFTGACPGHGWGGAKAGGRGGERGKIRPAPGPVSGPGQGISLSALVLWGPGGPVTNAKHD